MRIKGNLKRNITISIIIIVAVIISIIIIYNPLSTYISPFSYQRGTIDKAVLNNPIISIIDNDTIHWDQTTKKLNYINAEPDYFGTNNLYLDNLGRIWVPSDGGGLFMIENEIIHHWWSGGEHNYSDAIRGIVLFGNNLYSIHSGSDTGIMGHLQTDTFRWEYPWSGTGSIKGKPYSWGLALDSQNNLYITSDKNYLNIFNESKWSYTKMPCRGKFPLPPKIDNNENIWIYCDGIPKDDYSFQFGEWLAKYSNGKWIKYDILSSNKSGDYASTIEVDPNNRIWLTYEEGILVFENNSLKRISSQKLPFNGELIYDMAIDNQNRYWFITKTILGIYNGVDWQIITSKEYGLDYWFINSGDNILTFDREGVLWIGSINKIIKFNLGTSLGPGNINNLNLFTDAEAISIN